MRRTFKIASLFALLVSLLLFPSCGSEKKEGPSLSCDAFTVRNFVPAANQGKDSSGSKTIFLDYDHANAGFVIPSVKQDKEGLTFEFELKNNTSQELYYKIYYQNESYKFPEYDSAAHAEDPLSGENFYGSWENTSTGFKKIGIPADGAF